MAWSCFQGYGCMRKISTGSGISPRRLGEESGKPDRNNDYNKAHFGLRIYVCPAETVQLGVSCVVGLLLTQNFNGVWCQSLKTQGGERGNSRAIIITTKCISVYKYISVLTKLDNSACAYCGIVARTKFQEGLASVLKDTGRREGNPTAIWLTEAVRLSMPLLWDCCTHKISAGSGFSPRRHGEERGETQRQ